MNTLLRRCWNFLRQASGDDAYERYLEHQRAEHAGADLMTRHAYFKQRQDEKWSKVTRCC